MLRIPFVLLLLLVPLQNLHAEAPQPGVQVHAEAEITLGGGEDGAKAKVPYLIALPENYEETESCPLLIFLHGRGEWGSDLNQVAKHGPPKILTGGNKTPFIVVSPQSPQGEWWKIEKLNKLLDHILATTKADPSRVYLTGLSMGGFGTWAWLAEEPERFAAAIPICGGGQKENCKKLVDIPLWVFHGGKDRIVPDKLSHIMVDAIKEAGGTQVKLTIYPEAGHDSWTKTYDNPEIYEWLLSHQRKK